MCFWLGMGVLAQNSEMCKVRSEMVVWKRVSACIV